MDDLDRAVFVITYDRLGRLSVEAVSDFASGRGFLTCPDQQLPSNPS